MIIKDKYYHPKTIERKTRELLSDYYRAGISKVNLPIEIDRILELHLDLNIDWGKFNNPNILAGLIPMEKTIVMNEDLKEEFDKNKGRENFTKAHEIGHWILHIDYSSLEASPLPGFSRPYEKICRSDIQDWDEKNADRFAGYLLMPKELISEKIGSINNWSDICEMAKKFNVSNTAMKIRLEELGYMYIDKIGNFYKSKEECYGQQQLL